jgi:hypothetical protein
VKWERFPLDVLIKKADVVLIIGLCLFAVAFLFVFNLSGSKGGNAVIRRDGVLYKDVPLATDMVLDILSTESKLLNTVEIKDGKTRMVYAVCPDGLCLRQGHIRYTNETIVCLPNKVTVEIVGGEKASFDGIAQ